MLIQLLAIIHVSARTCIMRRRLDVDGVVKWALVSRQRCYCTSIVAPEFHTQNVIQNDLCANGPVPQHLFWFTDNVDELTKSENWTPAQLDILLDRAFCGKLVPLD